MSRPLPPWLASALAPQQAPCPGKILVAVSGGGDSLALLHGLLAAGWPTEQLVVGHVDHGLRRDSRADAHYVEEQACRLGIRLYGEALRWTTKPNADALRRKRREALQRMADLAGAAAIALAHTADDQRETQWLAMLRGSGLDGLAGMQIWRAPWWRPLLNVPRAALRVWARDAGVVWREDPTNTDFAHPRARLRHLLLPALARPLGPGDVLRNRILADERAWLELQAATALEAALDERGALLCDRFAMLPPVLQRRVLRRWLGGRSAERIEAARYALGAKTKARLRTLELGAGDNLYIGATYAVHDVGLPSQPTQITDTRLTWGRLGQIEVQGTAVVGPLSAWRCGAGEQAVAEANRALASAGVGAPWRRVWPLLLTPAGPWWPPAPDGVESQRVSWPGGCACWTPAFDAPR